MAFRAVNIHPLALRELCLAYGWYARRSLATAERFRLALIRDPHPVLIYAAAHARRRPGYWLRRGWP